MKRFRGTKGTIILLLLVFMLIAYYFYLSNRSDRTVKEEDSVEITQVQDILLRDLSRDYPATPKEVLRYYSEITKCFYNEDYTDEELKKLAEQAEALYDEALVAQKTKEQYLQDLEKDISDFKSQGIVVSTYKVSNSTDVNYFSRDGREYAGLYCTYTLRIGTKLQTTPEVFILRRDDEGHWKILGWDLAEDEKP